MNNRFEFFWDSLLCGPEAEISYQKFLKSLEEAIEHYNTDKCYVDETGKAQPHLYQDEDGSIVHMDHFEPDLYLFDKKLKRLIKLHIDGYDDKKTFNIELFDTSFQSLVEFLDGDTIVLDGATTTKFDFKTKDVELVKYCYKLIFESAETYELNHLLDSIDNVKRGEDTEGLVH